MVKLLQKEKQNLQQKKDYYALSLVKKLVKFVILPFAFHMVKLVELLMLKSSTVLIMMNYHLV